MPAYRVLRAGLGHQRAGAAPRARRDRRCVPARPPRLAPARVRRSLPPASRSRAPRGTFHQATQLFWLAWWLLEVLVELDVRDAAAIAAVLLRDHADDMREAIVEHRVDVHPEGSRRVAPVVRIVLRVLPAAPEVRLRVAIAREPRALERELRIVVATLALRLPVHEVDRSAERFARPHVLRQRARHLQAARARVVAHL